MKKIFIQLLTVMLVLSLCGCQKETAKKHIASADAKKKESIAKTLILPDAVDTSSIELKDYFKSDTENELHMSWIPAKNAKNYSVSATVTGTTGKDSVIKKSKNQPTKEIWKGSDTSLNERIKRNTIYKFTITSIGNDKQTKSASFSYFPSTYDDSKHNDGPNFDAYAKALWGLDDSANNSWKSHGNVLYLTKDYNCDSTGQMIMADESNPCDQPIIMDFAGHKMKMSKSANMWIHGFAPEYILTDSVGNGEIQCNKEITLEAGNGNVTINNGIFPCTVYIIANKGTVTINNGIFHVQSSKLIYGDNDTGINVDKEPPISTALIYECPNNNHFIINGGKYILDKGTEITDKKHLETSICSNKLDDLHYVINGKLRLSDNGKSITLQK